ncbi:MAG: hypothetical protein A3E82_05355 [Gammaproteobacteria bacterium RIFCSPHIGHO2_12_FULL_38_11]|nr:MAG: hypothetical protein A3E82_05355 [Gammaproteobacteria bacterium RIFCSPHIGHO2_12_FULL_38_11]
MKQFVKAVSGKNHIVIYTDSRHFIHLFVIHILTNRCPLNHGKITCDKQARPPTLMLLKSAA